MKYKSKYPKIKYYNYELIYGIGFGVLLGLLFVGLVLFIAKPCP